MSAPGRTTGTPIFLSPSGTIHDGERQIEAEAPERGEGARTRLHACLGSGDDRVQAELEHGRGGDPDAKARAPDGGEAGGGVGVDARIGVHDVEAGSRRELDADAP